jgi:hypothetical protein
MTISHYKIAAVSDVSVGYGSPQIPSLTRSLADYYGGRAVIYEPDDSSRPPVKILADQFVIQRVMTETAPYSGTGRIEYVRKVAAALNAARPPVLVIFCTFCLPVLLRLRYRPKAIIYSLLEMISPYGPADVELNRLLADRFHLLIFPEENRARLDMALCGFRDVPIVVMYNVNDIPDAQQSKVLEPRARLPRIYYGGTLNRQTTLADYFLREGVRPIPFDLYGSVGGEDRESLLAALANPTGALRYFGCIEAERLAVIRRQYAYSVVMYAPTQPHMLNAAPNKFFEAIADGVPPIAAPHPQCKMLIERYRCGVLMEDWSFEAFQAAVREAMHLFGTADYCQMVENCRVAFETELNWKTQFAKVRRLLPEVN